MASLAYTPMLSQLTSSDQLLVLPRRIGQQI